MSLKFATLFFFLKILVSFEDLVTSVTILEVRERSKRL